MIGLLIYVTGWMLCYRMVYIRMANGETMRYGWDGEAKVLTSLMSALVALVWPITFVFLFVLRFLTPKVAAERELELVEEREALKQREREAARREAEIDMKEHELGIGPYKNDR